jgi:hypothetical protein
MGGKYCGALFHVENDVNSMLSCLLFSLQVAFALLLQPSDFFGYMHYEMEEEFSFGKVIGQGIEVSSVGGGDEDLRVLKLFENM